MSSKFDRVMKIFASAGTDVSNNLVMSRFEARNNGETVSADVVRKADSGQNVSEEIALGGASEFSRNSSDVVKAIIGMKSKAAA